MYDGVWKFQDAWTTQLPWVELVFNEQGQVHYVRCKICTFVNDKEKWFTPKLDNLLKHECRNPTVGEVGGWLSHSQNGDLGVRQDSRNFRVRFQGSKELALMRSLYHWKAIKV
jgi:hypothetical protein